MCGHVQGAMALSPQLLCKTQRAVICGGLIVGIFIGRENPRAVACECVQFDQGSKLYSSAHPKQQVTTSEHASLVDTMLTISDPVRIPAGKPTLSGDWGGPS